MPRCKMTVVVKSLRKQRKGFPEEYYISLGSDKIVKTFIVLALNPSLPTNPGLWKKEPSLAAYYGCECV